MEMFKKGPDSQRPKLPDSFFFALTADMNDYILPLQLF